MTGPSSVDRGKPGSKIHVLSERGGLPLMVAISAANTHDSSARKPLLTRPTITPTSGTGCATRIGVRIARKGIDTKLG
jgi:hypothetical protein